MPCTEHEIGKGTIAYRGEDPDYWWRKSALWRPRRTAVTVAVAVAGLLLLAFAVGPLARHHAEAKVLARAVVLPTDPDDRYGDRTELVVRVLHEGATGTVTVRADLSARDDDAYAPGRVVPVTTSRWGSTTLGRGEILWPWVFGGLLLLVAAGRYLWDRRTSDRLHYFR